MNMNNMEEKLDEVEEAESASGDSFIDDSDDDDDPSTPEHDGDDLHLEAPLTDTEIEELVTDLLEVESKAAEAQESLERESLARVESEVREELAMSLQGDDLEVAVENEMRTFVEEWETTLDQLETESAHLLEQLDGSGIDLPKLYKSIESQAPNGCSTEAWRKRAHWVGSQVTSENFESIKDAENFLQSQRPVRSKRGKLFETGASGFIKRKLAKENDGVTVVDNHDDFEEAWNSYDEIIASQQLSQDENSFGGQHWASVYFADTPRQAANLGLKLPGVDEVEEIDDIEGCEPLYAHALANEKEIDLSEEQKKKFRKIKDEDDANMAKKFQLRLKRRRNRIRFKQESTEHEVGLDDQESTEQEIDLDLHNGGSNNISQDMKAGLLGNSESSDVLHPEQPMENGDSLSVSSDLSKSRGEKRSHECEDEKIDNKRIRAVIIGSDDEAHAREDKCVSHICHEAEMGSPEELDFANANSCPSQSVNVSEVAVSFKCTVCAEAVRDRMVRQHPILKVIVCESCKCLIEEKMQEKDPDCSECYCGWCGRSNDLISCKACKMLFCIACIKSNFGEECFSHLQISGWNCCCCSPSLLQRLTAECEKALAAKGELSSSSDSDSDVSEAEISASVCTKKRRKKKIRRILDDAELREETKEKIAIEKARQEHLRTLQEQVSAKSRTSSSASVPSNVENGEGVEVLGDATKGYIVNVVREKDEDVVRIPPSISAKLKPHQEHGSFSHLLMNSLHCFARSDEGGLGKADDYMRGKLS